MIVPLLSALAIVILTAKLGGWFFSYLKQPVVLGKLFVGLVLGPSLLNVFGADYFQKAHVVEALHEFGELGVIFLMFVAGLEVQLSDFSKAGKPAVLSGVLCFRSFWVRWLCCPSVMRWSKRSSLAS